jgi:tRNA threonylcarbamoyladenosine biosynthesis protein TsaB
MYILALETSSTAGSIAVAHGAQPIAQRALDPQQRSAKTIAPAIQAILRTVGWKITQIELVAAAIGPGSFTGLRVGVATAKTLAYALNARCVGANTLEVIAAQADVGSPRLSVAMDAQRGQVFAASFEPLMAAEPPAWRMTGGPAVLDHAEWRRSLVRGTAVSGPALVQLGELLPAGVTVVRQIDWMPRAATVASLAWQRHLQGAYDDLWRLAPLYLRKSAAEEKAARNT